MNHRIQNIRILANAGSGKTYRLVSRYIELLAHKVPAEKIIALTFTRMAAGEFLDKIFVRLSAAALSEEKCKELARHAYAPELTPGHCLQLLRQLVDKLPFLALGTLDSFCVRVVKAFPLECGLAGDPTVLDEHQEMRRRIETIDAVLAGHAQDEQRFTSLMDMLWQQNRDEYHLGISELLNTTVEEYHEAYLMTPLPHPWGRPEDIWPKNSPLEILPNNTAELAGQFQKIVFDRHGDMPDKCRELWEQFFSDLETWREGARLTKQVKDIVLKILKRKVSKKDPGAYEITVNRISFPFKGKDWEIAYDLAQSIVRSEIAGHLRRSSALYGILQRYEETYAQTVRSRGLLTFRDFSGILAAASGVPWVGASVKSIDPTTLGFRIDSAFDHWLLDEFQDTSRIQWDAIRNFIDEVVQDSEGRRSFFYVGDAKQAIYGWREGDVRLFSEIADYYNRHETRIDTSEALATSYRSSPEIIDAVNKLFGNLRTYESVFEFPEEALSRWESFWVKHQTAVTLPGYVRWKPVKKQDDMNKALDDEIAAIIQEVNPLERGLSCAVLALRNVTVARITASLRENGIRASAEGRRPLATEDDIGTALLSLLRLLAHPSDKLSRGHIAMTPLQTLLAKGEDGFIHKSLRRIATRGFAECLRMWVKEALPNLNGYPLERAEAIMEAAGQFDASFSRGASIDDFITFLEAQQPRETRAAGSVRVMTVHAAKGLDFDMVIIPECEKRLLCGDTRNDSIHLERDDNGTVRWGMTLPAHDFCAEDDTLRKAALADQIEASFENICVYYVAATRAKRAMYFLAPKLGEESKARDFNRLLHTIFGNKEWEHGNPEWMLHIPEANPPPKRPPLDIPLPAEKPSQSPAVSPSGKVFLHHPLAAETGRRIHETLAKIEWMDEKTLQTTPDDSLRKFLSSDCARAIFSRPDFPHTLWREKDFDAIVNGTQISGTFDRVLIQKDESDQPAEAWIWEFKTGNLPPEQLPVKYASQARAYIDALSLLLRLPPDAIHLQFVSIEHSTTADFSASAGQS